MDRGCPMTNMRLCLASLWQRRFSSTTWKNVNMLQAHEQTAVALYARVSPVAVPGSGCSPIGLESRAAPSSSAARSTIAGRYSLGRGSMTRIFET